tara:strand:+ start:16261 stop:16530 length:270 start_codon:yes stop_codon:yes gene_type:complete
MPSISGLDDKIDAVLACAQVTLDASLDDRARADELLIARALLGNLRGNMVRFDNDIETREQAERRVIDYSIRNINHSDCSSCMALSAAL